MKPMNMESATGIAIAALIGLASLLAPARARGAAAHVTASAQVIDPAIIDASVILADAAAYEAGVPPDKTHAKPVRADVKIVVVDGVTFLVVDYN